MNHPKALAFVQTPSHFPSSFATERFFALHAYRLVSEAGKATVVRYRIVPVLDDGAAVTLAAEEVANAKSPNYLFDDVHTTLSEGGGGRGGKIEYKLLAQVGQEGDATGDNTVKWPEGEREIVELGTISLTSVLEDNEEKQKNIIFDPVPRVEGVEPSDDPLLQIRAAVYLLAGRERRAA